MSITDYWLYLLLVGVCCHLPILVNTGRYWDSWFVSAWQIRRDDSSMKRFYSEVGMPAWYFVHRVLGRLPGFLYWYNLATFLSLLVNPILVFEIVRHTVLLNDQESFVIAAFSCAAPLALMVVDYIVGMHYVCTQTLFYAAWLLVIPTAPLHQSLPLEALAAVLFLFSFNMNSLLVFYGWVYCINFLIQFEMDGRIELSYLLHYLANTWLLAILPVAFWLAKACITPTRGPYAGYNKPASPGFRYLRRQFVILYDTALRRPISAATAYVVKSWRAVLFTAAWTTILSFFHPLAFLGHEASFYSSLILVGVGLAGIAFAGIPYLLVGQVFGSEGYVTKNSTLLGVPVGCCYMGLAEMVIKAECIPVIVYALLGIFVCYWTDNYIRWYAITAKYAAILHHYGNIPNFRNYQVVGIWDQHHITAQSKHQPEHGRGCANISYMLSFLADKKPFCICFPDVQGTILQSDGGNYSPITIRNLLAASTIDYCFSDVDPGGPQAFVIIRQRKVQSHFSIAVPYLRYFYFQPDKLGELYERLLSIEVIPLPGDQITLKSIP